MIRNRLENPIILFFVLLVIISINLIASINFFLIMFSGVLFTAFYIFLKKRYLYSLIFVVIAFLFIEINSGLKPFSLTLLSLFIYIFIIPKSDSYGSYDLANSYVYMLFFYVGLIIMWSLFYGMDEKIFFALLLNILFDFIFFGVFL
ncbi:hypothetical protein FE245_06820 [Aliarcobacter cibarius]|jgi:hypothetical protein|uniref:Putative membrane protein n=1 Tax=Aliarcobacter cibarius TaxID=255507 RepID=A0A5J6RI14_9BACT|nr:putative membrane protein [Aliarcobacter cibarius]QKJ27072.1 putative membrane protein [Aliarcobacter cibarius]TLS98588.1 hypothetical protein FE247_06960 [Aliarcobacter cibarius]TLS99332.1 hypothetical protein FE245_06820 [Aliarcobacter cibarius]TLT02750.1 hypothetical protein FE248_09295 [Aliarcobacter cibarius]